MDNERRAGSTVTIPDGTQSEPDANTIKTSRSQTPPPPPLARKATHRAAKFRAWLLKIQGSSGGDQKLRVAAEPPGRHKMMMADV